MEASADGNNETSGMFCASVVGTAGDAELRRRRCPPCVPPSLSSHGGLPKVNGSSGRGMKYFKGKGEKVCLK